MNDLLTIINSDALTALRQLPSESVQCCVTSPPYWGLRDYGVDGQIGLEKTPEEYAAKLVEVFRECRRVLKKDGTLWLNLGDSYAGSGRGTNSDGSAGVVNSAKQRSNVGANIDLHDRLVEAGAIGRYWVSPPAGLKPKDLIGIPWRVAFALQSDGWWLRSDIVWSKRNCMPESVRDRPTTSHEYIFLLTRSRRYYYDADAIREKYAPASINDQRDNGNGYRRDRNFPGQASVGGTNLGGNRHGGANARSVWTIAPQPFPDAHFATFPTELPRRCIMAGSRPGDLILDCFAGSGTTGKVAIELGRRAILIEPKTEYVKMIHRRTRTTIGLPLTAA